MKTAVLLVYLHGFEFRQRQTKTQDVSTKHQRCVASQCPWASKMQNEILTIELGRGMHLYHLSEGEEGRR